MTKKWLWYVCIGLICCSSLAYVYAKQTTGTSNVRTERIALIEKLESVREQIQAVGETPELKAIETELLNQLYPGKRNSVQNETIARLAEEAKRLEARDAAARDARSSNDAVAVERSDSPLTAKPQAAPTELELAKAAYERMLNEEMLPGDKALIEAYFPEPEFVRPEEDPLDDNGGTWVSWTGSLATGDNNCPTGVYADIVVAPGTWGPIQDIEVRINSLTHTYDADLDIKLVGPNNVEIELSTDNGSFSDNYVNTVFDDEAATLITAGTAPFTGTYRPEGLLSTYDGISPVGTWRLHICDDLGGDVGTLTGWEIQILAPVVLEPDLSVTMLSPCGNQEPNGAATVSLRVTNNGQANAAATTAHFDFDGGATTDAFAVPLLGPSSFFDVFFTVPVNLTVGAHTLVGSVDAVAGELNTANNTTNCNLNVFNCFDYTADMGLGDYTNTSTTVGAGDNCALRTGPEHIYKVIIATAGAYTFTLCNSAASYDSYFYLTTACCGGTTLASNDDDWTFCPAQGALSTIECFTLAVGTYYLDIEPWSSTSTGGAYTLDITLCPPCLPIPPNDNCADATVQTLPYTWTGSNLCATEDCALFPGYGQVWIAFDVPVECPVILDYCGSLNTLSGPFGNAWLNLAVGCPCASNTVSGTWNDTDCADGNITITWTGLAAGTYYYPVLLDDASGADGDYNITVHCGPPIMGRCCYLDEFSAPQCLTSTATDCATYSGLWDGTTTCELSGGVCPVGRCCYTTCSDYTEVECNAVSGTWTEGLNCTTNPCPIALQGSDDCANAPALTIGQEVTGTTIGSLPETEVIPSCGSVYNATSNGVWYTVVGNGDSLRVSLCSTALDWDSEIFVFCGNCDVLACVGGNDQFCGNLSELGWASVNGTTYYILIAGWLSGDEGAYNAIVTDVGAYTSTPAVCNPSGRCCYVNAGEDDCMITGAVECFGLGGQFTAGIADCNGANACPMGRCCYGAGLCQTTSSVLCASLTGTWTSSMNCEDYDCPVTPTNDECATATAVVIPPYCNVPYNVNLEGWTATCTDICGTICDGNIEPELSSTGPDAFFTFTLTECRRIAIKASSPSATSTNFRDSHISVKDVCCTGTFILGNDDFGANDALPLLAWLPAENRPLTSLGSMVAGELPAGTYHVRAGLWGSNTVGQYELTFYDYGPCVEPNPCAPGDVITNLTVRRAGSPANSYITLYWNNTNAGDYNVWSSTNPNNTGWNAGTWTLETLTPLSLPSGLITWDRAPGFESYINFVVVPDCDPTPYTGRCCYSGGCTDNTLAECTQLAGTWTLGMTCACEGCPSEARCCYLDVNNHGACDDLTLDECNLLNGTWTNGSTCAGDPCELGRCCYLDVNNQGACADVQEIECTFLNGTWTAGVTCASDPCDLGRCCYSGGCDDVQLAECNFLAGSWDTDLDCSTACPTFLGGGETCADAVALTIGVDYLGTTVGHALDTEQPTCEFYAGTSAPGVWYTVVGNGDSLSVSLCDAATDYDSQVGVYCGGCAGLTCVSYDDDFCSSPGLASDAGWAAVNGTTYYVLVTGYSTNSGNYGFTVVDHGAYIGTPIVCP
ncbi:proprotein convertase P-domain-containing protein [bacterium]|nr:proprotein convertase P-domain-containing protein [bacterium]